MGNAGDASLRIVLLVSLLGAVACSTGSNDEGPRTGGSRTAGERDAICAAGASGGDVQESVFVRNLRGQTSWYASPVIADLDGDGEVDVLVEVVHVAERITLVG